MARAYRTTGLCFLLQIMIIIINQRELKLQSPITKFSYNTCNSEIMNSDYTNTRLRYEKWVIRGTSAEQNELRLSDSVTN